MTSSAALEPRDSAASAWNPTRYLVPRRPIDIALALALVSLPLAPFLNTFSPLGTALRVGIAAGVIVLILAGRIPLQRDLRGRGRWLILAFALFQLIPLLGAESVGYGLVQAVNWTMFMPLAFVAYDRRSQRTAVAFAAVSGVLLAVGAVLQALDVLGGTWAGFALSDGTPATRYTSFLLNPNDLGLWMLSLGVLLGLVTRGRELPARAAGLIAVAACGVIVSLTLSRGAFIALAGVFLYLLLSGLPRRRLASVSGAALVGLLAIPLAVPATRESISVTLASLAAIAGGDDRSSTVRADRWSRLTGGAGTEVAESQARNGLPLWTVSSSASASATAKASRDGERSAQVVRKRDGGGAQRIFLGSAVEQVGPGIVYTATGHCRPQRVARPCRITLVFSDAQGRILSAPVSPVAQSSPGRWTRVTRTDGAPPGTARAEVRAEILGVPEGETHYLDSFALTEGREPVTGFPERGGQPLSFPATFVPAPPRSPEAQSQATDIPRWSVSFFASATPTSEMSRDGKRSARLTRKRDGGGAQRIFLTTVAQSGKPGRISTWTGHCRPRRVPRPCRILLRFRDARGQILSAPVGPVAKPRPGRWTQVTRTVAPPAGTVRAELRAEIFGVPEGETHYLDSFALTKGPRPPTTFPEEGGHPLSFPAGPVATGTREPRAALPSPAALASTGAVGAHSARAPSTMAVVAAVEGNAEPPARPRELTLGRVLFGSGYGDYEVAQSRAFEVTDQEERRRARKALTVDNGWLKLFLEEGIIGLGLFLAIFAIALWRSFSARRGRQRVLALTTGAVLIALGVRALSADVLDINPWNFLVWLLVGLAFTAASGEGERRSEPAQAPR